MKTKEALKHAAEVEKVYGLNVRGCALDFLGQACEFKAEEEVEEVTICGDHEYTRCMPDEEDVKGAEDVHEEVNESDKVNALDAWTEYGEEILQEDALACEGHMSERNIAILHAEVKELVEVFVQEFDTLGEIKEALK